MGSDGEVNEELCEANEFVVENAHKSASVSVRELKPNNELDCNRCYLRSAA